MQPLFHSSAGLWEGLPHLLLDNSANRCSIPVPTISFRYILPSHFLPLIALIPYCMIILSSSASDKLQKLWHVSGCCVIDCVDSLNAPGSKNTVTCVYCTLTGSGTAWTSPAMRGKRISLKAGEKREMIQRQVYEVVKQMQFQADLGSSKWTAAIFVKPVVQAC